MKQIKLTVSFNVTEKDYKNNKEFKKLLEASIYEKEADVKKFKKDCPYAKDIKFMINIK
jgi:hypothetical protein